ncbi:hypothetical protein N7510_007924 [Penicillium lagena]|uniref:uncharacterized protein n=1 Tax=Penicillium lagena TaxID=94218 RepID=UPI0025408742|nr:uncharacterized protein N7510_007924 [Penicillium lagena]KAJ5611205.1 hypothetical protein N7510_007924 [Penicillium lagena]
MLCTRLAGRGCRTPSWLPRLFSRLNWSFSRKYWFSLLFNAIVAAKLLHIYSHLHSLPWDRFVAWGPTLFLQDALFLILCWCCCRNFQPQWMRFGAVAVVVPLSLAISCMAAANISFYFSTGAEIHWRQAHYFHRDAASIKTLLTGLGGLVIVEVLFIAASWFTTPYTYNAVGWFCRILWSFFPNRISHYFRPSRSPAVSKVYEQVARDDYDAGDSYGARDVYEDDKSDTESVSLSDERNPVQPVMREKVHDGPWSLLIRLVVLFCTILVLLLRFIRPSDPAYWFLSQTLIISPFEDSTPRDNHPVIEMPDDLPGNYTWLGNHTALGTPPAFDWLPSEQLAGFRDWYSNSSRPDGYTHYDPSKDPLHISNLKEDILQPLREALHNGSVNIKHVFVFELESTRADVFPLRKKSYMANRIRKTYSHDHLPEDVEERLANLTRTAERLTGVQSGWERFPHQQPYGGIRATNSYTGGTFTLKSIAATVCGLAPLVVDFNREYLHHIYQPCLPHIFGALNAQSNSNSTTDDYTSWTWRSLSMQSITDNYDNQGLLMPKLGFEDSVTSETLAEDFAEKGIEGEKYNFWGYTENQLGSYFREAILNAEEKHERLFISHLTGISHHPWTMPDNKFEEMVSWNLFGSNEKLNRYLNTIGFVDGWLGQVLDILEETGVANETLLVMTGDHGISLAEDGGVTPYDNPHVSNFHVPLVFAHPHLPPIEVTDRVTSMQILPTILDLLMESSSVDDKSMQTLKDLLPLYEGQSMIRDLVPQKDEKQNWQFTVMNSGGTWLALRSAAYPYRLVIPLVPDVEWRFSDVDADPHELHNIMAFDLSNLIKILSEERTEEVVQWVTDAAHVAQWWLSENWRRYEYVPE